jgi:hypothetical protein
MRKLLVLMTLVTSNVFAAPFLVSDPYPSTGAQPDSASFTVNGGTPISCTVETVTGGVQPKCDLSSIKTAGVYTLVMTVTAVGGVSGGNTYTSPGSASSAPFAYTYKSGSVSIPMPKLIP